MNQLTAVTVDRIPMTKEAEVITISMKPQEEVDLYKGYYHSVCVLPHFNKEYGVDRNEEQKEMEANPDEENMEDAN